MTLAELNSLTTPRAEAELTRCCASTRWIRLMAAARPFLDRAAMDRTADRIWWSLSAADWLEAFAAHPPIGGRTDSAWSKEEQTHAARAAAEVADRLARGNRQYEERFGFTFLVCATGKSADEIVAMLERRLPNAPEVEVGIAAEEQRKITHLRLKKLVTS